MGVFMRVPCPTASAGDSHINHRGGESKQLLWCVRRAEPCPHHIPACPCLLRARLHFFSLVSQILSMEAAVSGFPGKPSPPTQGIAILPLLPAPHLLPAPAVMEKGCHCPQVPQGWRVALPWPWVLGVTEGGAGRARVTTGMRRACGSSLREEQREGDEGLQTQPLHPRPGTGT